MALIPPVTKDLDQCQPRDLIQAVGARAGNAGPAWALVGNRGALLVLDNAKAPRAFGRTVIESEDLYEPKVYFCGQNYVLTETGNRYPPSDPKEGITVRSDLNGKVTLFIRCELLSYKDDEDMEGPPEVAPTLSKSYYNVDTGELVAKSSIGIPREKFSGWTLSFNSGEVQLGSDSDIPTAAPR